MRQFPIDPARITLISTGVASPVIQWIELADGSRRPDPEGRQDKTELGVPMWRVEVIIPGDEDDDRDKTGVYEVAVAQADDPKIGTFGEPLTFVGLTMSPGYVKKGTSTLTAPRWSADGVSVQHAHNGRSAAAASA